MEHLNSRFRLLVDAVNQNHTREEIKGLAISIEGAAHRLLSEHGRKGEIASKLRLIRKQAGVYIRFVIEEDARKPKVVGGVYHHGPLSPQQKSRVMRSLELIQKYIQEIASELQIELKEVIT